MCNQWFARPRNPVIPRIEITTQGGLVVSKSYEAPTVTDLGAFADLTQKGTGKAQDSSEGSGSG
jgi:hypothetical protein